MRWVVGVDVGEGHHGALGFVAWGARSGLLERGNVVAVHVLEEEHLRVVLRLHHLDEVTTAAREAAERTPSRQGVTLPLEIVTDVEASDGLAAAAGRLHAEAIVVGRHAGLDGTGLGRLGRIARRTLRELAVPVIVAPHDLTPEAVGGGPVLALSSLGEDSIEAVRFARRLADWMGRELVVAHAVRVPTDRSALEEWTAANGVRADHLRIVEGSVLVRAPRLATELQAPILVAGSRMLTSIERQLDTSVGSELAAAAPLAVAVVPPKRRGPVMGF